MAPRYSVIIHPPESVINEVRILKQKLQDRIGWYPSCNSLAHITFNLFSGHETTLAHWEEYVASFVKPLHAFTACFNRTGSFNNGAFFLAPRKVTHETLTFIMKNFLRPASSHLYGKSVNPHISIGRQLKPEQLILARELIKEIHLEFTCDNLTIRKFNAERGQYDIYKHFPWGGAS